MDTIMFEEENNTPAKTTAMSQLTPQELRRPPIRDDQEQPLYPDLNDDPYKVEPQSLKFRLGKIKYRKRKITDKECEEEDIDFRTFECVIDEEENPNTLSSKKNEPTQEAKTPEISLLLWIIITLLLILVCIACMVLVPLFRDRSVSKTSQVNLSEIINNLEQVFQEQPTMTFLVVKSAMKRVIEPEPEAPAIILLLAGKGAEDECDRFAHHLVYNVSENPLIIEGKSYKSSDSNRIKKDLSNEIDDFLHKDGLRSVLIRQFDEIPGDAAMIFHSYFDHENAPFKRVVYVMTVTPGERIPSDSGPKSWDNSVQNYLGNIWHNVGKDQMSSLFSRLTVSVAAIVSKNPINKPVTGVE